MLRVSYNSIKQLQNHLATNDSTQATAPDTQYPITKSELGRKTRLFGCFNDTKEEYKEVSPVEKKDLCFGCKKHLGITFLNAEGMNFHIGCFKCSRCTLLFETSEYYLFERAQALLFYCRACMGAQGYV